MVSNDAERVPPPSVSDLTAAQTFPSVTGQAAVRQQTYAVTKAKHLLTPSVQILIAARNKRMWTASLISPIITLTIVSIIVNLGVSFLQATPPHALDHTVLPSWRLPVEVRDEAAAAEDMVLGMWNTDDAPIDVVRINDTVAPEGRDRFMLDHGPFYAGMVLESWNTTTRVLNVTLLYNQTTPRALPTLSHFMHQAMFRNLSGLAGTNITATDHIFPSSVNPDAVVALIVSVFVIPSTFGFVGPVHALNAIKERAKKQQFLLIANSCDIKSYWAGTLFADMILFTMSVLAAIATMWASYPAFRFLYATNFLAYFLVTALYGPFAASHGYLASFLFDKEETAQKWVGLVYTALLFILVIVGVIAYVAVATSGIGFFGDLILTMICPPYVLLAGWLRMSLAFISGHPISSVIDVLDPSRGILSILVSEVLGAVAYFAIVLHFDRRKRQALFLGDNKRLPPTMMMPPLRWAMDDDVAAEKQRVLTTPPSETEVIRLAMVSKVYPPPKDKPQEPVKVAVKEVSLGMHVGECFALLGPNGAGKTSLIGTISGQFPPTTGMASVLGYNVMTDMDAVFGNMGHCAQEDILFEELTGRQHLELFANIHKVPPEHVASVVEQHIDLMDLREHADKASKTYSGGNKRKLSVALALIGNPRAVFLDEPATGMDVVVRRRLWDVILEYKKTRCVILTTHSMEEADALADRIGIMIGGELRCLGTSQHLKHKYGSGYSLTLTVPADKVEQTDQFVDKTFPGAVKTRSFGGSRRYSLPTNIPVSRMFGEVERVKSQLAVDHYSLSQASLEQIFIGFASEQQEGGIEVFVGPAAGNIMAGSPPVTPAVPPPGGVASPGALPMGTIQQINGQSVFVLAPTSPQQQQQQQPSQQPPPS